MYEACLYIRLVTSPTTAWAGHSRCFGVLGGQTHVTEFMLGVCQRNRPKLRRKGAAPVVAGLSLASTLAPAS